MMMEIFVNLVLIIVKNVTMQISVMDVNQAIIRLKVKIMINVHNVQIIVSIVRMIMNVMNVKTDTKLEMT